MEIFLSWSGARTKAMAETFAEWISQVIQAVEPWISSDIEKGTRWNREISDRLERSKIGIVCLAKENLDARWILFEAGALSKTKEAQVCTLLLDIAPGDVEQPLGQFQHTVARDKEDIRRLVGDINRAVKRAGEKDLTEAKLNDAFSMYWPRLLEQLEAIAADVPGGGTPPRSDREILEEILQTTRNQERRLEVLAEEKAAVIYQVPSQSYPLVTPSSPEPFIHGSIARYALQGWPAVVSWKKKAEPSPDVAPESPPDKE